MVEPISATAGIGLAFGILGFVLSTLTAINARKHDLFEFRFCIQTLSDSLRACQLDLVSWDDDWNYQQYSQDIYRRLWREEYTNIHDQRQAIGKRVNELTDYLLQSFGIKRDSARQLYPTGALRVFRVLRFAFFSKATLESKINKITKAMSNLKSLSDRQLTKLRGPNPKAIGSGLQAGKLEKLEEMGQELFWNLRREKGTMEWALELAPRDRGMKAEEWWDWDTLRISLSFRHRTTDTALEHQRITLGYKLQDQTSPAQWTQYVLSPHREHHETRTEIVRNPVVTFHARITNPITTNETFRRLFGSRFLEDHGPEMKLEWQSHQAHLVLSVSNWALLFWGSDWTANLCSSSIRYTELSEDVRSCLHIVSLREDHEPHGQQVQQAKHESYSPTPVERIPTRLVKQQKKTRRVHGQPEVQPDPGRHDSIRDETGTAEQDDDDQHRQQQVGQSVQEKPEFENCKHHSSKLVNFGLLLAEIICATPFRVSPEDDSVHQKWTGSSWVSLDKQSLLIEVHRTSMSAKFRGAVEFCLDEHAVAEGISALRFYSDFIDYVVAPIVEWQKTLSALPLLGQELGGRRLIEALRAPSGRSLAEKDEEDDVYYSCASSES
ncbi:hypothetical protein QBC37DRAFT_391937 [Rhypophila decipiens]|uniref:Uncharacterized protein n=1 Tax=Rhypophila decipiens TaxID=261697 RepID=A0AAN7B0U8_9PEZI|nr:hypothetical protein QBC37DRAFT_391937 [Rhypophila decipiens]